VEEERKSALTPALSGSTELAEVHRNGRGWPPARLGRGFQKLSELFLRAWKLGVLGPRWPWYDELIRLVGERKHDRVGRVCELS
jgi:hypothetical protein